MILTPSNTPEFSPIGFYYINLKFIFNREHVWILKKKITRYGVSIKRRSCINYSSKYVLIDS